MPNDPRGPTNLGPPTGTKDSPKWQRLALAFVLTPPLAITGCVLAFGWKDPNAKLMLYVLIPLGYAVGTVFGAILFGMLREFGRQGLPYYAVGGGVMAAAMDWVAFQRSTGPQWLPFDPGFAAIGIVSGAVFWAIAFWSPSKQSAA
jgi:uncharacterized membrane protein YwzB